MKYNLQQIIDEFAERIEQDFKDVLHYALLSGSVAYGGGRVGKSDIDIALIFKNEILTDLVNKEELLVKIQSFTQFYLDQNRKHNFVPDEVFPGEYLTLNEVDDAIRGRGFEAREEQLYLSQASDEYYLSSPEHWFRAWLSMQTFSIFCYGDHLLFSKYKKNAWKTTIKFILTQSRLSKVSADIIIDYLMGESNKWVGMGVTTNYLTFKDHERQIVEDALNELWEEDYCIKQKAQDIYCINEEKLSLWQKEVSMQIQSGALRQAKIFFTNTFNISHGK